MAFLNALRIPIQSEAFQMFLMSNVLRLHVQAGDVIFTFCILAFFLIVSSPLPSYRAGKMRRITAIQHVG